MRQRFIGDYSASDPNTHPRGYGRYSEKDVFNRRPAPGATPISQQQRSDGLINPPLYANINAWQLYIFTDQNGGSGQVLQANPNRTALIIRNQSDANMYVNFSSNMVAPRIIGLLFEPGDVLVEDVAPPSNSVWAIFESTPTTGYGVFIDGSRTLDFTNV